MNYELLEEVKRLSKLDKKTLSQKALKTGEEFGELSKAVLPYDNAHGTRRNFVTDENILEEVADIMLCALSIGYSLGFNDNQITVMMAKKAVKWANLQNDESRVESKFPFEIHVSVMCENWTEDHFSAFKIICARLRVKPTVLELQNQVGADEGLDVMTSCVFHGTNETVLNEVQRIALQLEGEGFNVIRKKIETLPWHPAAPSKKNNHPMPKDCYFESHYEIEKESLTANNGRLVSMIVGRYHAQFSRNKRRYDQVMITLRSGSGTFEGHEAVTAMMIEDLLAVGVEIKDMNNEFSIYDTNILHDAQWMTHRQAIGQVIDSVPCIDTL